MEYLGFTNRYLDNILTNLGTEQTALDVQAESLLAQQGVIKTKYTRLKAKVQAKKEKVQALKRQSEKPNYKCHYCQDKVFIDESSLDAHFRKRHS